MYRLEDLYAMGDLREEDIFDHDGVKYVVKEGKVEYLYPGEKMENKRYRILLVEVSQCLEHKIRKKNRIERIRAWFRRGSGMKPMWRFQFYWNYPEVKYIWYKWKRYSREELLVLQEKYPYLLLSNLYFVVYGRYAVMIVIRRRSSCDCREHR